MTKSWRILKRSRSLYETSKIRNRVSLVEGCHLSSQCFILQANVFLCNFMLPIDWLNVAASFRNSRYTESEVKWLQSVIPLMQCSEFESPRPIWSCNWMQHCGRVRLNTCDYWNILLHSINYCIVHSHYSKYDLSLLWFICKIKMAGL